MLEEVSAAEVEFREVGGGAYRNGVRLQSHVVAVGVAVVEVELEAAVNRRARAAAAASAAGVSRVVESRANKEVLASPVVVVGVGDEGFADVVDNGGCRSDLRSAGALDAKVGAGAGRELARDAQV